MKNSATWKFDENIVPIFDDHVRKHVPFYDELHQLITDISGWFLEDLTNVYDVGTSIGEVIANIQHSYPDRKLNIYGIDNSYFMAEKAAKLFKDDINVTIMHGDAVNNTFKIENASLVTSVLTLQFIKEKYRQSLVDRIYEGLNPGGGFILVEKVIGSSAKFNEIWVETYHEMKVRNGVTEKDVIDKSRAIRGILKPLTVDENINMLQKAGFEKIDTFFKWGNFAGFLAIK